MIFLLQISRKFPAECNSERIFKNDPTLLKYPPKYTAYFLSHPV